MCKPPPRVILSITSPKLSQNIKLIPILTPHTLITNEVNIINLNYLTKHGYNI